MKERRTLSSSDPMSLLSYSKSTIAAFELEIARLKESEFPYDHSSDALGSVESIIAEHSKTLGELDETNEKETIRNACDRALETISNYLPILGFILRSTNIRNAFEVYGPFLQLTKQILGPKAKLLFSSEWEYSPFNYRITPLRDFVFIGLPAHESSNPFLIPLAGHELGHSIWLQTDFSSGEAFKHRLEGLVIAEIQKRWAEFQLVFPKVAINQADLGTSLLAIPYWQPAVNYSHRQAQETFCDYVGVGIFSESFLHAFAYLTSANPTVERSRTYPNSIVRVTNLENAAASFGVEIPKNYRAMFSDRINIDDKGIAFLVSVADAVLLVLAPELLAAAKKFLTEKNVPQRNKEKVNLIFKNDFSFGVPTQGAENLTNILNSAWAALESNKAGVSVAKESALREIVLKSIEVLEVDQLTKGVAT